MTLDKESVALLPTDRSFLHLDDLRNNGWDVKGPSRLSNGSLSLFASHEFSDVNNGTALLRSVAVPFSNLTLSLDKNIVFSNVKLSGEVDLSDGLDAFLSQKQQEILASVDPTIVEKLTGKIPPGSSLMTITLDTNGRHHTTNLLIGKVTEVSESARVWSPVFFWVVLAVAFGIAAFVINVSVKTKGRYSREAAEPAAS